METRMTWEQIKEKYPGQWVGLTDVEYEEDGANIASAIVTDSTSTQGELGIKMFNGELLARYTTPDSCGLQLGMAGVTLCI